jgi:uncharacterized protein (DUF2267 family)
MNVDLFLQQLRERAGCRDELDAELLLESVLVALSPLVPWPAINRLAGSLPAEWVRALRTERFDDRADRSVFESRLRAVSVSAEQASAVLRELSGHLDVRGRHALRVGLPDDLRGIVAA